MHHSHRRQAILSPATAVLILGEKGPKPLPVLPIRDSIPASRFPIVNGLLIAANILVFLYELSLPPEALEPFVRRWAAIPAMFNPASDFLGSPVAGVPRLITSMFLHGSLLHVGFNMLFLWVFGDNVEDRIGHVPYLIFYLACGIAAAATQIFFSLESEVPIVGASGAIGGVLGAYMIAFPHARVLTFFWFFIFLRFIWIPALFYLGLWFVMQLFQAVGSTATMTSAQGGVAFWAHVGGFVAGAALILVIRKKPPLRRLRLREGDYPLYPTRRTWR